MELVGGHPYLVRQAFYSLAAEKLSFADLAAASAEPEGPFDKHLQFYRRSLDENPAMRDALARLLRGKDRPDEGVLERLAAVGLVKQEGGAWSVRCGLYERYFRRNLQGA
jgi:hypothetical protein